MQDNKTSVLLMCNKHKNCDYLQNTVSSLPFEVTICETEDEAIEFIENNPQDIIISEYELEHSNGVEFLKSVYEKQRNSTRIIVGSHANEELIVKAVIKGIACTYIEEASDNELVVKKLTDIARVRSSVINDKILDVFPSANDFPINMTIYEKIMEAINEDAPLPVISKLVSRDVTLTAKVLQVANSAFFGNFYGVSIEKAIIYMGLNPLKDIVLLHSLSTNLKMNTAQNKALEEVVRHSINVNYYLHAIAKKTEDCPITTLNSSIGIIHDIGKIVQLAFFPLEYATIEEYREENPTTDYYKCETETGNLNINHGQLGSYFLRCWNFNQYAIEAALFHHEPESASEEMKACVEALFLANTISDIRDGYDISLEEALTRCTAIKLTQEDILTILPPVL